MFGTWVGVVLLFVVFGLFVWVVIGAVPRGDSFEEKRAKARAEKSAQAQKDATAALTSYAWVDKNKGLVRVPIERGMELALAELASKMPVAANPIAAPEAQSGVTQSGAPAPSPAPAASSEQRTSPTPKPVSVAGPKSETRGQPTGATNPASAPPGTQPGASATPAASPPSAPSQPNPAGAPVPTPVQSPPGTPLPVRGNTPP
jgi:hypothetical protein